MIYDNAVDLAGFYLTLVSILMSVFTINLINWIQKIDAINLSWKKIMNKNTQSYYDNFLSLYFDASEQKSKYTLIGWLVVTFFIFIILSFMICLVCNYSKSNNDISLYILSPMLIFIIIYVLFSSFVLFKGYKKINSIFIEIANKLNA